MAFDPEALQIIEQLEEYHFSSEIQNALSKISTHINNYDFDLAKEVLGSLLFILAQSDEDH